MAFAILSQAFAAPIVKSGDCPALTRTAAASGDDWGKFPYQPSPASQYPVNTIQNPLTPSQSINCIVTPAGLKAELWASEEMKPIAYLQHFTFDERGRLWAVEPRSYPNDVRVATGGITDPKFVGGSDRIVILEDTDGDHVMDKLTVFRDGLAMPQSIEVVNGGVVVGMTPYLVFFPNHNDTAGTPQILWSGMGPKGATDTHSGINSLMYGLDNWVYGHTGYGICNAGAVNCGDRRVWRFRHTAIGSRTTEFQEWTTGPIHNGWGIGQMEDGQIFQTGSTITSHINHSIRQGAQAIDIRSGSPNNLFYPLTGDRYLFEGGPTAKGANGWFTQQTTSTSSMSFYTSRTFPSKYWNRFAFTCEGTGKLCNQDSLVVSGNGAITGSTWRAVRMPGPDRSNLLASTDAWVAPLQARTGPDGAMWVLDWYNYLFLHNALSPYGDGRAWLNALRVKTHNRIYRIVPADGKLDPILDLSHATVPELIKTFTNSNFMWRLHAQRLLLAKGYTDEMGTLLETILKTSRGKDAVDNDPAVVHALWTLNGLGRFDLPAEASRWNPILKDLLLHPAVGVRRNVLMAMPRTAASAQAISDQCSVNDPHGHVRLQALIALAEIKSKPAALTAMWTTYKDVDTSAASAFANAGIAAAASKPCEPTLASVSLADPGAGSDPLPQLHNNLRFRLGRSGFHLEPHGGLASGTLEVFAIGGKPVFRSEYSADQGKWSSPDAAGLGQSVYLYSFRGAHGYRIQGRLPMLAGI